MSKLTVEIVTAERLVYRETDVDMVVAPGGDGVVGILPNHAPMMTTLAAGELRVKKGGAEQSLVVFGGFMEVTPSNVVVLADAAERVEEIDLARAEAARKRAEEAISRRSEDIDIAAAESDLRRATLRLRVSDRKRTTRRAPGQPGGMDTTND